MCNRLFSLITAGLILIAWTNSVYSAEYSVDPSHSRVGFSIRHLVSKVSGEFRDYDATFSFDPKKPEVSKGKFTVKAVSIWTNNDKRDEHLRGPDFFDAAKFDTLKFELSRMIATATTKFRMDGNLTIRGVVKPVTFDVEYGGTAKDPWGKTRAGFTATTKINRKDFGMEFNKTLDTGGLMLGDDVMITLEIEAVQK